MTTHISPAMIARYAGQVSDLNEVTVWSIEVHLEDCADCRALVAGATTDDTAALLARVAAGVDAEIAAGPAPAPRRRRSAVPDRWLAWHLVPWLTMTVAMLGCAALLQALQPSLPSLVTLLAPVAPLPGVVIAWSRRTDPAWELIASTPAAGLAILLRRTAAVLTVVVPALAVATSRTGASLALTLLPCLAFTAATLALGGSVGVDRAAVALAVAWSGGVVLPSLAGERLPSILLAADWPGWAAVTVALTAVLLARAAGYRRLGAGRP